MDAEIMEMTANPSAMPVIMKINLLCGLILSRNLLKNNKMLDNTII